MVDNHQNGNDKQARQVFEEILEIAKDFDHAAEIRQILDEMDKQKPSVE